MIGGQVRGSCAVAGNCRQDESRRNPVSDFVGNLRSRPGGRRREEGRRTSASVYGEKVGRQESPDANAAPRRFKNRARFLLIRYEPMVVLTRARNDRTRNRAARISRLISALPVSIIGILFGEIWCSVVADLSDFFLREDDRFTIEIVNSWQKCLLQFLYGKRDPVEDQCGREFCIYYLMIFIS